MVKNYNDDCRSKSNHPEPNCVGAQDKSPVGGLLTPEEDP